MNSCSFSPSKKVTVFVVAALLLQLGYFATTFAGFDVLSLVRETKGQPQIKPDQAEKPFRIEKKPDAPVTSSFQIKQDIESRHSSTLPPKWKQQQQQQSNLSLPPRWKMQRDSHPNLLWDFSSIFDVIYTKTKPEFSPANDLAPISNQNLADLTYSLTTKETAEFEASFAQLKNLNINDDASDEELDKSHSNSRRQCILLRYLPGCSCHNVKGGSICAPRGTGRCSSNLCFVSNRPIPQTFKMIKPVQKVSTSGDNILQNAYFAPSISDRIFRTKLDLATKNQEYFLQKMHHACRMQRLEGNSSTKTNNADALPLYRCRAETYPSSSHILDADFLRNKRTNNSLMLQLYNKPQPMFLRMYCMIEHHMGVTNSDLTMAGCLGLAVDLMSRDSSVVVDIVIPTNADHRDNLGKQPFADIVDVDFLKRIAKYYGIEVIMGRLNDDDCEKCIWVEPNANHCFRCCVVDSRVLAKNTNLEINTATSWAEKSLPLAEMYRQFHTGDVQVKTNFSFSQEVVKDGFEINKVNFSIFGGTKFLKQVYDLGAMKLTQNNTELWKLGTAAEVKKFADLERRLEADLWYSDVGHERDQRLRELAATRGQRSNQLSLLENISFNASIEGSLWSSVVTFDHDWNSCVNNKLRPFGNIKNNNRRTLMISNRNESKNGNRYLLEVRNDESYLLSLRVTGVHFSTYHECRSGTWLPTLDWLQPPKSARMIAQDMIRRILENSLDKKTFLAVHLRYENDAYVWTMDYLKYQKPNSQEQQINEMHHQQQQNRGGRFSNKHQMRGSGHDTRSFTLVNHLQKVLEKIDRLAQDLKVGAVFISNAAPIHEYQRRFEQQQKNKQQKTLFAPWFTGASFVDKSRPRTRHSSLIDRIVIESATVAVVWDPFTGLSSFSQRIYDHRCRRMRGLSTFSYSIGVGHDRDESLVLEC